MRKIKYCVECSLDGFIARQDHTYDFLIKEGKQVENFKQSLREFEIVIMGKKTYEIGLQDGYINPNLPLKQYVISSSMTQTIDPRIELVQANAVSFIEALKKGSGGAILLSGGATLASTLLKANLIDEFCLRIHPVLISKGIALFSGYDKAISLQAYQQKMYSNGIVLYSSYIRKT
jgi:dihydrofolate reductase